MAFSSLSPLRHRSFALALGSNFVSSTGSWMQSVALGIFLTETTHDPIWLGLLTVAAWTPALIGSPLGGVIADRWNRQRWIQSNNLVMALTASALAAFEITHRLTPLIACLLAVVEGFCGAASWAAWQSLLPDLVDRAEVLAAVSLSSAQFNLGRVIGPTLAALALAVGSPGLCFAINAASFVVVVVVFSFVRSAPRPAPTAAMRFVAELIEGSRAAWRVRGCRNPIIGVAVVGVLVSPFIALVPAMAIDVLHGGGVGTAWLVAAQGVGAVIGAVILPAVAKRTSRLAVLRGSVIAVGVAELAYGLAPTLPFAVVGLLVLGGGYVGMMTGLNTSVQLHAPTAERSRILALYTLSLSLSYPLGALAQASVAHVVGVRAVTVGSAALVGMVVAVVTLGRPSFWHEIGAHPEVASANLLAD